MHGRRIEAFLATQVDLRLCLPYVILFVFNYNLEHEKRLMLFACFALKLLKVVSLTIRFNKNIIRRFSFFDNFPIHTAILLLYEKKSSLPLYAGDVYKYFSVRMTPLFHRKTGTLAKARLVLRVLFLYKEVQRFGLN